MLVRRTRGKNQDHRPKLQVIKRDMLLIVDYKSLADRAAVLEEASFGI